MRIGKGLLAGGAVVVGALGLLLGSGVASGASGNYTPYGMMSGYYGSTANHGGLWGMMERLFGSGSRTGGSYPYYGMMGGYYSQGGSTKGSVPYYGMMGGYYGGSGSSSESNSGSVSAAAASRMATQLPQNASVDRSSNTITFHGQSVQFTAMAAPSGGPELSFEVAGLVNPKIVVQHGARVSVQLVNEDPAAPHDFVVSSTVDGSPAFSGAASPVLGTAGKASMPASSLSFTASTTGSFIYQCTVPGHAQAGMQGSFVVSQ